MTHIEITHTHGTLIITQDVLQALANYAQYFPDQPEQGGVLIGHHPHTFQNINVTQWTTPQEGDRATQFHFHRSADPHMKLVHEAWEASEGALTYVGEWHTHPEEEPLFSRTDLMFWRKATQEFTYPGAGLVFIIVGTVKTRAWYMARGADLPDVVFEAITPMPEF